MSDRYGGVKGGNRREWERDRKRKRKRDVNGAHGSALETGTTATPPLYGRIDENYAYRKAGSVAMKGVVLMVLLLSACNSVQPRLRQGDPEQGPFPPRRVGLPGDTVTGTQWPQVPPPDRVARQQRICRTQRVPGGWVIRSYETDANACVGSTNEYNVAVIEDLSHYRIDAVIGICADQSIPGGWYPQTEPAYECPGARVTQGSRTGITIRKENGDD